MTAVPPAELNGTPYPGSNPFRRPSSAHSQSGAFPVKLIAEPGKRWATALDVFVGVG